MVLILALSSDPCKEVLKMWGQLIVLVWWALWYHSQQALLSEKGIVDHFQLSPVHKLIPPKWFTKVTLSSNWISGGVGFEYQFFVKDIGFGFPTNLLIYIYIYIYIYLFIYILKA